MHFIYLLKVDTVLTNEICAGKSFWDTGAMKMNYDMARLRQYYSVNVVKTASLRALQLLMSVLCPKIG